jgi:hypothetical protein
MNELYVTLLDMGLGFLRQFIASLTKQKAPAEVIDAVQASITALEAHQNDVMSKADWEQARG